MFRVIIEFLTNIQLYFLFLTDFCKKTIKEDKNITAVIMM